MKILLNLYRFNQVGRYVQRERTPEARPTVRPLSKLAEQQQQRQLALVHPVPTSTPERRGGVARPPPAPSPELPASPAVVAPPSAAALAPSSAGSTPGGGRGALRNPLDPTRTAPSAPARRCLQLRQVRQDVQYAARARGTLLNRKLRFLSYNKRFILFIHY